MYTFKMHKNADSYPCIGIFRAATSIQPDEPYCSDHTPAGWVAKSLRLFICDEWEKTIPYMIISVNVYKLRGH